MTVETLRADYPWLTPNMPAIIGAPMMRITMAEFAVTVSACGGIGFLAGGFDLSNLSKDLTEAAEYAKAMNLSLHNGVLPIGIGFQNWGADLELALDAIRENPVAAAWFFAPRQLSDLLDWAKEIRAASQGKTKIWIQVGTVAEAIEVVKTTKPDVLIIQGADSGGHGLAQRASIITLLPEIADALAEHDIKIPLIAGGGIVDGRGVAAAVTLGAHGVTLGTRFLASHEVVIAKGYQDEILRVSDGGVSTVNSKVYDVVRGIKGWPVAYYGRGVANMSYLDALRGMSDEDNEAMYVNAMTQGDAGWGPEGRMTTYAGTGVGLVKNVMSVKEIVSSLQQEATEILKKAAASY